MGNTEGTGAEPAKESSMIHYGLVERDSEAPTVEKPDFLTPADPATEKLYEETKAEQARAAAKGEKLPFAIAAQRVVARKK
jgi:hypothetical protein